MTTVVDLRSTRELMTEGPAPLDAVHGVQHAHHPVLKEFLDASDTVAAALLLTAQQEDAERYPDDLMTGHYLGYLENRPEEVVGALRSIVDRAGGGHRALRGGQGPDRRGRRARAHHRRGRARGHRGRLRGHQRPDRGDHRAAAAAPRCTAATSAARPVRAHEARAETMRAFLEQLDARYGGLPKWLADQRLHRRRGRAAARPAQAAVTAVARGCLVDVYDTILKSVFVDRVTRWPSRWASASSTGWRSWRRPASTGTGAS